MAENGVVVDNFRVKKMAAEVEHCHNLIVDLEMNLTDLKMAAVELAVKPGEEKVYRNDNLTLVVPDVEDKVDETELVAVVAAAEVAVVELEKIFHDDHQDVFEKVSQI